jgi:hypothetical protein
MVERASGRTVEGGERSEVTELRTFMRARGGNLAALRHPADLMFDNSSAAPTKGIRRVAGCATSIGCCPPVNIEPRCDIAPTTMIDAVVPHGAGRATT